MQVKQAHDLFALHHDTTITGDNTSESPLSVRTAEGEQPGIVSLGDIDNRLLALIRNNPTYPEIQTADNRLALTDDGAGIVKVDTAQTWIWRGLIQLSADDFDLADRSFATAAKKTYHLRWNAPGTGNATAMTDWPNGRFELADLTGATPSEDDLIYDSTFDRMLIARIVTDSANVATITTLINKALLNFSAPVHGVLILANAQNSRSEYSVDLNWSRTPTLNGLSKFRAIYSSRPDHDFSVTPQPTNDAEVFSYGASAGLSRYKFYALVMDDYINEVVPYTTGPVFNVSLRG